MKKLLFVLITVFSSLIINAEEYSLVITADTFKTKSYDANNGDHTIYGSNGKPYIITTASVMQDVNKKGWIQFSSSEKRDKGTLESIIPGIIKVVVDLGTSEYMNLTVIIGNDTIQPTNQGSVYTFNSKTKANYLLLTNDSKYAASQKSITIYFTDGDVVATDLDIVPVKPVRVLQTNQIVIIRGSHCYNIIGQLLW